MGMNNQIATPLDELAAMLAEDMAAVDQLLQERMVSEYAPLIPQIAAHLIGAGGKRMRPLLTIAAARLFDYQGKHHHLLASTVELIHTATLLHDDVVDESAQRRGRPTANLLWDNKSSVLVGDYLFSRSFQLMVETQDIRVLAVLANASATIAEGEVLQLAAAQDLATNEDTYIKVVRGKTAALFSAATEVGAMIAGANDAEVTALREYGDALGIAFQIVDDLLDYGGVSQTIGKNTGDDFRERKLTLPVIKAVAQADQTELDFWSRTIGSGDQRDGDLEHARELLLRHSALEAAKNDALDWADRAKKSLSLIPDSPLRELLADLAGFVTARVS